MRTQALSFFVALALTPVSLAQDADTSRPALEEYNLGKQALGLEGYDPVAYFPEYGGKAKKGEKDITLAHRGVTYRFTSEKNREAFQADPNRFEPTYGGWCAWAMAEGKGDKVDPDESSFTIEDGRLYLFYDGFFADTRKKWHKGGGAPELAPQADENWTRMSGERPPAKDSGRDLRHWNLEQGLALAGYDPTAYFESQGAMPGDPERARRHEGVTYRFRTDASLAAFVKDPARFEPAYGGWCAYAMSKGKKVAIDPEAFLVEDGRLLLFKSKGVRELWLSEGPASLRQAADVTWNGLHR